MSNAERGTGNGRKRYERQADDRKKNSPNQLSPAGETKNQPERGWERLRVAERRRRRNLVSAAERRQRNGMEWQLELSADICTYIHTDIPTARQRRLRCPQ